MTDQQESAIITSQYFALIYRIKVDHQFNAPEFLLHLSLYTPNRMVHGTGRIMRDENPPFDLALSLEGRFFKTTRPNNRSHMEITATGYPIAKMRSESNTIFKPVVQLRMLLENNWQKGKAQYTYMNYNGNMLSIDDSRVTLLNMIT